MAASLVALKQGCRSMSKRPLIDRATLDALRDHCLLFRDSLPQEARTGVIMSPLESLLQQCASTPTDLFYWESVLSDVRDTVGRLREPVARLCRRSEEAGYWFDALATRIDIVLNDLYALAPWLAPPVETELRMGSGGFRDVLQQLCKVPRLGGLPAHYTGLAQAIQRRLEDAPALPEPTRTALGLLL